MPNSIFKPVTSTISTRQEKTTFVNNLNASALTYTLCDRTDGTSKEANYFVSFNLPYNYSALASGSTLALSHPELFQLNVDKIVIAPIPKEFYNEILDGRSLTILAPQYSGSTAITAKTVVSSTYSTLAKSENNVMLGGNIAFLFCDEINRPYTGQTGGGAMSNSANSTWNTTSYTDRPAAVPYTNLSTIDINTDQRPWSAVNLSVNVPASYPTNTNQGYNYDIPVGFIALDKGFIVYTHPMIVNNMPWALGQQEYTNIPNTTSGKTDIYFSATTTSNVDFIDISINFKTTVVCLALPQEFYFTNNPSWDLTYNLIELTNQTNGFQSVYTTEIGLYNRNNELVAVAKLSEPLEKTYTNIINFTLDIDV
jgi:hypothetical protein